MQVHLIQTITKDDLILNGLYIEGDKSKPVYVMVHGFTSDFFSHKFFHEIQEGLRSQNIASIAIQTRGTGIRTEFIKKGREDSVWIGSFYEVLSEAHLDISAFIEFLTNEGYQDIILLGHSLGTIKAVRYIYEGEYKDRIKKLVLLAPFDKNGYIVRHTKNRLKQLVDFAKTKVDEGLGDEIVTAEMEDFLISYKTYVSWYEDTDLSNIWDFYKGENYNFPAISNLQIPVKIIVGNKDSFFYMPEFSTLESVKTILEKHIKDLELHIIEGSGHTYVGFEKEISKLV